MDYIFTKEAFELYLEIPASLIDDFWEFFETEQFLDKPGIIHYFMVQMWFDERKMPYETQIIPEIDDVLQKIRRNKGSIEMEEVFKRTSCIFYKNHVYLVDYDLERAENIFSKYEESDDYDESFGHSWWKYLATVEELMWRTVKQS
jgi:hypothetical protein